MLPPFTGTVPSSFLGRLVATVLLITALIAGQYTSVSAQDASPTPVTVSTPSVVPHEGRAVFTFVQASATLPAVDLLLDNERSLSEVTFGQPSAFLEIDGGDHTVTIVPVGGDVSQALVEQDVTLDGEAVYDLVLTGPADELQVKAFEVDLGPVTDDDLRLRVIHAAPSLGAIDLAPNDMSLTGFDPVVTDVGYFDASDTADFRAGEVTFEVRATGERGRLLVLPPLSVAAGTVLEVIVAEDAMGEPLPLYVALGVGTETDQDAVTTPEV